MIFLKIFLLTLTILIGGSKSIVLKCKYEKYRLGYACIVNNSELVVSTNDKQSISEVQGTHTSGLSNNDVRAFKSNGKTAIFFPRGLTIFFKNIETVQIINGKLQKISKDDLRQFGGNLKKLWLDNNELQEIKGDLFEFNPNLENMSFTSNKIVHIDSGAFDGLVKRDYLNLSKNPCTEFMENKNFLEIIREVEKSCKNPTKI
jgi:Leucine-rich repeat (LRR) protein